MSEKQKPSLTDLASELVGGREFAPRTPHSYSHLGETALPKLAEVVQLFPDLPETKLVFGRFPEPEGAA